MTNSLPANPSLENLKKQAKSLQKKWRAGDAETLSRIRAAHPQYATAKPRLSDCQLVLAREAGFESWPQMKVAVQAANQEAPSEFVTFACLCYDDPHYDHRSFHARAHEMCFIARSVNFPVERQPVVVASSATASSPTHR